MQNTVTRSSRIWFIPIVIALVCGSTGCVDQKLMHAITTVRESKYGADKAFSENYRAFIRAADQGWTKKHGLQKLIIDNTYADWLRNNGAQYDKKTGNIIGGTVPIVNMIKTINARDKMMADLVASQASWETVKTIALKCCDAYDVANTKTYASEQEATVALDSAKASLTASLQAIGAFTGGVAAGFVAAGL